MNKKAGESFIEKAKQIHDDKYDYSKVEYFNNRVKVCIICPEHGEFWQTPHEHLHGCGCQKCGIEKSHKKLRSNNEEFIKKSVNIHGNKYDYSKVEYFNAKTNVCIICPEHGEFWQKPFKHLSGHGCPNCCTTTKLTLDEFIKKAKEIHGDKYDYSKVEYENVETKVCIICPEHGEFWQTPDVHLYNKCGCSRCSGVKKPTTEEFIESAKKIHGDKYDYSKVEYINNSTKVCIICPEHGEFWQTPANHLKEKGCPVCRQSKLEKKIYDFLTEKKINFEQEKKFDWLKFNTNLRLDFYLPDYNIAIECQGEQHYKPVDMSGRGENWALEQFKEQQIRDTIKQQLCEEHGILVLYYRKNDNLDIFKKYFEN